MTDMTLCAYGRTVKLVGPDEVVQLALKLLPSTYRPTEERCRPHLDGPYAERRATLGPRRRNWTWIL